MTESAPKRLRLVVGLALVVATAFALGAAIDAVNTRNAREAWLDEQAALVEEVVREALTGVVADLEAAAAYVAQANPDHSQFENFVTRIGGDANALGVGHLTAIPADGLDTYLEAQRRQEGPDWDIFGFTEDGDIEPIARSGRRAFYPVHSFTLGQTVRTLFADDPRAAEIGSGMEAGFDPRWRRDIERGLKQDGPSFSQSISMHLDRLSLDSVFFAMVPVKGDDGSEQGLVLAMMVEELLLPQLESGLLDQINWETITPGESTEEAIEAGAKVYPLELPGAVWTLAVSPTDEAIDELDSVPWWVAGTGAAVLALLLSLLLWLAYDRRAEHKRVSEFQKIADDKDRFLASVSHELRTPLTVVSGLAHEFYDQPGSFDEAEKEELLRILVDQTEELGAIVEDLLVAARTDIGKVTIHYGNVNLGAEVTAAMESSSVEAHVRGKPSSAYGDPQRVRQILRNLLTNAKRYGGSEIRVDFGEGTGWVEAIVSDNGPGIPNEKRDIIFDPYRSAHRPSASVESVGLGLYISRNLAQAMGGDLEYVYDGAWSHFRLRLQMPPRYRDNRGPNAKELIRAAAPTA